MNRRPSTAPTSPSRVTAAANHQQDSGQARSVLNDNWTAYRPRRYPIGLAIVVGVFSGWFGFLIWMVVRG